MASPKPKPKKQDEKPGKPQIERFKETARNVEADESGGRFERALDALIGQRTRNDKAPPKRG